MTAPVRPGLCSVTFRGLGTDDVVRLASEAQLDGIEWAGDVHAPPGDVATASALAARCRDAGLATASYGSYVTARTEPDDVARHGAASGEHEIGAALDVAEALGASTVRVWAGTSGSSHTETDGRRRVADQLRSYAEQAHARGLHIGLEHHAGTLTDTIDSALHLLSDVDHPALLAYWQPRDASSSTADGTGDPGDGPDDDADLAELDALAATGRLAHLHVFSWASWLDRWELARRSDLWPAALARAAAAPARVERYAYLEFVRDDDPDRFLADAHVLRTWTNCVDSPP